MKTVDIKDLANVTGGADLISNGRKGANPWQVGAIDMATPSSANLNGAWMGKPVPSGSPCGRLALPARDICLGALGAGYPRNHARERSAHGVPATPESRS